MSKAPFILIVEDDEWLAEQHIRSLNEAGMHAEAVPHALAAIDALDTRVPDALVLDVLLAGPNAFALLHEMQSHPDLSAIPVILCTNNADQLVDEDLKTYGVRQVLDKTTMAPNDVVVAVKKVLP